MVNINLRNFLMIGLIAMVFSLVAKVVTIKTNIPVLTQLVNAS